MRATVPRLQVLTDMERQDRWSHLAIAEMALRGGADAVQFREKRLHTARELIRIASAIEEAARAHDALLIVDDRADVALAAQARGLHLGRDDLDPASARAILGLEAVIGGTANSFEEAERVWASGVDYLGVGPVFGTRSKANPAAVMGLDEFGRICAACPLPVVAIGSITAERIPDVIAAGAHGVAVLSAVLDDPDPAAATQRCRTAIDAALGTVT